VRAGPGQVRRTLEAGPGEEDSGDENTGGRSQGEGALVSVMILHSSGLGENMLKLQR
jgi:hypothetical protein